MGAKIPKGVLLFGPPGTGKTLLAKAVAGEAGVPFFSISGSDFVEMFVGVGASRVRDLFEQAKAAAPAIVFVDEIDAVGRHRGAGVGGGHDEREQTLNQLLVEMDGFDATTGVILLASTNRPDILDPALLRPGRFDRQIVVDRPDLEGRKAILAVHARGKPLAAGVDLDGASRGARPGFTGADLANLVNEAALLAGRRGLDADRRARSSRRRSTASMAGPERRSRLISDARAAGHRLPRGRARAGRATRCRTPTRCTRSRSSRAAARSGTRSRCRPRTGSSSGAASCVDELAMLLGGRSAEELIFADPTTGAQNDIDRATTIARQMVTEFGMSERLGPMRFGQPQGEVFLGRDFSVDARLLRGDRGAHRRRGAARCSTAPTTVARDDPRPTNRAALDRLAAALSSTRRSRPTRSRRSSRDVEPWTHAPESGGGRPSAVATSDHGRRATSRRPARQEEHAVTDPNPLHAVPEVGATPPVDMDRIERAVREILEAIGEDPDRDGLRAHARRASPRCTTRSSPGCTRTRRSTSPSRSRPTTTRW